MPTHAADPSPVPLEASCQPFDACLRIVNQRSAFHHCVEGLLLPVERNKSLSALAHAEPIVGGQQPGVQRLQWFLSASSWHPATINRRRLEVLRAGPRTTPDERDVLVIDEHGDRK